MANIDEDLVGPFDIEFVGDPTPRHVNVAQAIITTYPHILWLEDDEGALYPWTTIVKMTKCK